MKTSWTIGELFDQVRQRIIDSFQFNKGVATVYKDGVVTKVQLSQYIGFVTEDDAGRPGLFIPFDTKEEANDFAESTGVVIGR